MKRYHMISLNLVSCDITSQRPHLWDSARFVASEKTSCAKPLPNPRYRIIPYRIVRYVGALPWSRPHIMGRVFRVTASLAVCYPISRDMPSHNQGRLLPRIGTVTPIGRGLRPHKRGHRLPYVGTQEGCFFRKINTLRVSKQSLKRSKSLKKQQTELVRLFLQLSLYKSG